MFLATSYEAQAEMEDALAREARPLHWSDQFATYQDACDYYGCDGPAQAAAEDAYYDAIAREDAMDDMEANGVVPFLRKAAPYAYDDDLPF